MPRIDDTYRLIIAGDILPSANNINLFNEGDAEELFGKEICALFRDADCSVVNIEGALTDSETPQNKVGPILKAPTKTINGIKNLGVTIAALANNHIMDYNEKGYFDTIDCLNRAGIQHVGVGNNCRELKTHISVSLGKWKVCIYNVSESFFNVPDDHTPGANIYDEYIVCNELRELKSTHDYLIVIYHGGAEYVPYPTPMVRRRFHRMADSGADFITAQHTHCIGCEETYNGAYLLYGQGNFFFARQKTKSMTREGLILELCFGNTIRINKHKVYVTERDVLRYSEDQSLSEFMERSGQVDSLGQIALRYEKAKADDIMERFLLAFKGRSVLKAVLWKLFPDWYLKSIRKSYSDKQIRLIMTMLTQERVQEDMSFVWRYIYRLNGFLNK